MAKAKIIVVGAGPAGALAALYAASRGDDVEVYELRADLRNPTTMPLNFTRSINLAISERGINSLLRASCPGLVDAILAESIPMHGRMIHGRRSDGSFYDESQAYDARGRSIRAADRGQLNKRLLDELERMPNVKLFFSHKLTGADFDRNKAWFEQQPIVTSGSEPRRRLSQAEKRAIEVERSFDLMIGADGAHSAARFHLMKFARMSYQQDYIDTLWCEFHIPPAEKTGDFRISPHHLHIWPGKDFMFIAIPSQDRSFTCTLFLPVSECDALDHAPPSHLVEFFETQFPGVIPDLISPDDLVKQYATNPHLPLISIKCSPYHYSSSIVILGDAAHAMVPFYGQGMNAGLEDVRVLFDILDKHRPPPHSSPSTPDSSVANKTAFHAALAEYTAHRRPDAFAINDLALRNYQEMRSDVQSPLYLLRKRLEELCSVYLPSLDVSTQYSRISFGNDRYSDVELAVRRQTKIFKVFIGAFTTFAVAGAAWTAWMLRRSPRMRNAFADVWQRWRA